MIVIVDYGMGNLRSVHKALERVGFPAVVTQDPTLIGRADAMVLPGGTGRPFLGICLGLQLLFSESEEFSLSRGLDVFRGKVVRFPFSLPGVPQGKGSLKVPHMGWNSVRIRKQTPALEGIEGG
ncbi:MAG: imidazole glycerol phosphate synthase subunit HisH, partial [Deltaproteobacteria bacterium SM23_61]